MVVGVAVVVIVDPTVSNGRWDRRVQELAKVAKVATNASTHKQTIAQTEYDKVKGKCIRCLLAHVVPV